jgi:ornithine cyclodeaminase
MDAPSRSRLGLGVILRLSHTRRRWQVRLGEAANLSVRLGVMEILEAAEIRRRLVDLAIVNCMREALIAYSSGECETPMPMHLGIAGEAAEVHIKSSYRRGGPYFALKLASTFPGNLARGLPVGNGMMLLCSAETGEPVALLADGGHLTDVRTAAVAAMVTRELGRRDTVLGIVGSGIQARLQARFHAGILELRQIWIWGRTPERAALCRREIAVELPGVEVCVAETPAEVARQSRLIVTATAAREPLLRADEIQTGTLILAVGADAEGKQELDPEILRRAALLLVDSRRQCEKLGELQHARDQWGRAVEAGEWLAAPETVAADSVTVADFTGLGVEDLYIAEKCWGAGVRRGSEDRTV